jgi:uncharacterized peroxidase-related enzyme
MAFIATVSPREADGDARAMYERQQGKYGYVPNYARVFSHRPEIMGLWASLLAGIRRHVEPRTFELVTSAAAHAMRNSYCALAHGKALTKYLPAEDVRRMFAEPDREASSAADAAVVAFARKVAVDASAVTKEDIDDLKHHGFSDAAVFDIAATAAARAFFAKLLDALGAKPDSAFLDMEPELREALATGRPIDTDPPEHLPPATDRASTGLAPV